MSFRGRRRLPGSTLLAVLAVVVLTIVGTVPALAAEPFVAPVLAVAAPAPDTIPEPRVQKPSGTPGFRLPFASGPEVRIEQGWNTTFSHKGKSAYAYDFGLYLGTDVLAAAAGVVSFVHDGETKCGGPELRKNANYITINHADGSATQYGHLSVVGVKVGDVVAAGQVIGKSGDTGYTQCLPHLHFARQYQGGGVTKSVPVYFQGYAKKEFHTGDYVVAQAAACPVSSDPAAVTGVALGTFCATYTVDGLDYPVSFARQDAVLSFDWRSKGPGGYWLDSAATPFSAHWNGDIAFPSAGTYTIAVVWSGAVTVSIDGVTVVERASDQADPVETVVLQSLGGGIHRIDVQYTASSGHGVFKLGWGRLFVDE